MEDARTKLTEELAAQITARFDSDDIKSLIADTKAAADGDTGTFEVVITTENIDRYQEVIKLDGWDLTNYLNNPVVLWMHDHTQPIGVATGVRTQDGKMIATGKFAPTPFAQEIRSLYDAGIIRATSVGFIEKEREGNLITKAELLEFSFVSVPANPFALSLAMEKDLNINQLVTKGFMVVTKSSDEPVKAAETGEEPENDNEPAATGEVAADEPIEGQEKALTTKQVAPIAEKLRSIAAALEDMAVKGHEPEGGDEPEADDGTKALDDFSSKRRIVQEAATILGDVLAEARKGIEARK